MRPAASAAKSLLAARLADEPGVVGVGLARRAGDYVVKVDLADASAEGQVPGSVDGVPVVTEVIGTVTVLPLTEHRRPADSVAAAPTVAPRT